MNCEEVKIYLNDYIDEELDEITRHKVEYHIRHCDSCIKDYKKFILFFDRLKDLPLSINPPQDLINKIKDELLKESGVKIQADLKLSRLETKKIFKERKRQTQALSKTNPVVKKSKTTKQIAKKRLNINTSSSIKKFLTFVLLLFLLVVGYIIYDQSRINHPWQVIVLEGTIRIDDKVNQNKWFKGSILKTYENSIGKILVPSVGLLFIEGKSNIELETAKKGNNEIKINYGKIKVINTELIPSLKFLINNIEIIDKAGEFIITVDNYKNIEINVNAGFVEIIHNNNKYLVDKNYICKIQRGMKPSLPIRKDASDSLKLAVDWFELRNGGNQAIEKIINFSRQSDMLTLLSLIPRVNQLQRQIIFQIISNYFPPPETITRAGVIRLEEEMLYRWWEEIEWQI